MQADNSAHLAKAARRRSERTLARAEQALRDLEDTAQPVTVTAVATRAGVSRAWLYNRPDLRQRIEALRQASPRLAATTQAAERASDASLRQRLTLAHQRIDELSNDNDQLRQQLAKLHGQLRAATVNNGPVKDTVHDTDSQVRPPERLPGQR